MLFSLVFSQGLAQQLLTFLSVLSLLSNGFCENNNKVGRNITAYYNKGCDIDQCRSLQNENSTNFNNTAYFRADGVDDSLHYLWSTIGIPSLLIVHTSKNVMLETNWTQLLLTEDISGSVKLEPKSEVHSSMLVVFSRLIEYDDKKDKADISQAPSTPMNSIQLADCTWKNANDSDLLNSSEIKFQTFSLPNNNGDISLNATVYKEAKRDEELPHLASTVNSTQFSIGLENLSTNYTHSRFALEMYVVCENCSSDKVNFNLSVRHSIDDEYTPGVFELYQVQLAELHPLTPMFFSYLQWKPVSYNNNLRSFISAVLTKSSDIINSSAPLNFTSSLGAAFYGQANLNFSRFNLSFGTTKDKFYAGSPYISWTSIVGYGNPPEDQISMLMIIIISVGLGIPVLIIMTGGTFICFKKLIKKGR